MDITIAITTFSKRLGYVEKLLPQIRQHTSAKIILIINGEKDGDFNEEYRLKILSLCLNHANVFPIFFIETRGLSKLWNTGIIASNCEHILMLNDDIEIHSNDIFEVCKAHIESKQFSGLTKINGSFSHFIVNKSFIDKIGYFDERLLGFGEEDGDISFRMLKHNYKVNDISIGGVHNIISPIRHEHIKSGIGKYSSFNREFIYTKKYSSNNKSLHKGMFDTPMDQLLPDVNQYPYENFFKENKTSL